MIPVGCHGSLKPFLSLCSPGLKEEYIASVANRGCRRIGRTELSVATLLNQLSDEGGPAGLMTGAQACAVVTVKIFVEQDQVAPMLV
jgi:hypothetical protein